MLNPNEPTMEEILKRFGMNPIVFRFLLRTCDSISNSKVLKELYHNAYPQQPEFITRSHNFIVSSRQINKFLTMLYAPFKGPDFKGSNSQERFSRNEGPGN